MFIKADRGALKAAARENLRQAEPKPWKVTAVYILLTTGLATMVTTALGDPFSLLMNTALAAADAGYSSDEILGIMGAGYQSQSVRGALTFFLNILLQLYAAVMAFGFTAYNLRRTRGEVCGTQDLLCGFGTVGRVVVMSLVIYFFTLGWSVLVIVPISLFFAFSIPFLLISTAASLFAESLWIATTAAYLFFLAAFIAGFILVYFLSMRYAMSPFLLLDHPEWSGLDAVRRSRVMLRGRLGELFKIDLSFLGWGLLQLLITLVVTGLSSAIFLEAGLNGTLTAWLTAALNVAAALPLGIWLFPYYHGTRCEFYRFLCQRDEAAKGLKAGSPEEYHGPEPF